MANDIRESNTLAKIIMYTIVIAFTILAIYPIYWLIIQSFKTTQEYMSTSRLSTPQSWTFNGIPNNFFTVNGAVKATNDANSGVVTVVFPTTAGTAGNPADVCVAPVPGVTAYAGEVPASSISPTAQYTGSITWSPADSVFEPDREYTATITLNALSGFTFNSIPQNFFSISGARSVRNNAGSGVITAVFTAAEKKPIHTEMTLLDKGKVITLSAIPDITIPEAGAAPASKISTFEYKGKIEWSPNDSTFKNGTEYTAKITLKPRSGWFPYNYPWAWTMGKFGTLILNSIFYTAVTVFFVIILSFLTGFAFAKIPSKLTPLLHGSYIIGILLTIQSIMVPLFLMIMWVGLLDTRLGVLIPYVGLGLPMAVYLATAYIKSVPDSIIESARIDGAKYLHIFWKIIMPIASPVAATVAILGVTGTWNEFMLINILVSRSELRSLPVGISMFSGALASDYGKQFSALVIGMVPMIIFYLIFRKQITKGVSAGAVKG